MARIKHTPVQKHVQKAVKAAANVVKEAKKGLGGGHTTKLKVPFKPASVAQLKKGKKALVKQLKRRYACANILNCLSTRIP